MFNMSPKLGIDLGTTTVLVFVPNKGIVLNEPSVVAVARGENRVLAVGNEAKEMVGRTPDEIIAYRPMKDGVIADYRVTEAMLAAEPNVWHDPLETSDGWAVVRRRA